MRAAVIETLDGPDAVVVRDVAEPVPEHEQVLVDVAYAGVVYPDVLQTRGEYQMRPDLPFVPGWEVSGVVRADTGGFRAGARVVAMPVLGGFARTVAVDRHKVYPLPDAVSLEVGAALPLNYLTAHFGLLRRAMLTAGETVLVHGAGGGLGTATCQLAAAYGARVIAVASTREKRALALASGAHEAVPVEGFREQVGTLTGGAGVNVIVDPVGGDRFTDSLRCLAPEGRLLVLGFTGGQIPTVPVDRLLLDNTTVLGVASEEFWRLRPDHSAQQWRELQPLLQSGEIAPPIGAVFDLEETSRALRRLDDREAVGRVLIRLSG